MFEKDKHTHLILTSEHDDTIKMADQNGVATGDSMKMTKPTLETTEPNFKRLYYSIANYCAIHNN